MRGWPCERLSSYRKGCTVDERLLLVEDDASIREIVSIGLKAAGFRVATAVDGREGLARVRADGFDAVLLDVMLPSLDGYEVCREIRKFSRVPIVMLGRDRRSVRSSAGIATADLSSSFQAAAGPRRCRCGRAVVYTRRRCYARRTAAIDGQGHRGGQARCKPPARAIPGYRRSVTVGARSRRLGDRPVTVSGTADGSRQLSACASWTRPTEIADVHRRDAAQAAASSGSPRSFRGRAAHDRLTVTGWPTDHPADPGDTGSVTVSPQERIKPLVGTPVPAVTRTGPSPGTWLTEVPRTWRTASAMPFMPWM